MQKQQENIKTNQFLNKEDFNNNSFALKTR